MDGTAKDAAPPPPAGACSSRIRSCMRAELTSFMSALLALIGVLMATLLHDKIANGVRDGVLDYVILRDESSASFPAFLDSSDPSAGALLSTYYIYNVTNAIDVVTTGAKPHLVAIGPLRYNYRITRHNISFEAGGEELVYKECVLAARGVCVCRGLSSHHRVLVVPCSLAPPPPPRSPPHRYQYYTPADDATRALELASVTNIDVLVQAALRSSSAALVPDLFPFIRAPLAAFTTRSARDFLWGYVDSRFNGLLPPFPGLQVNDSSLGFALAQHSPTRMATGSKVSARAYDYLEFDGSTQMECCAGSPRGEAGTAGASCAPLWSGYDANIIRGGYGTNFHPFLDAGETLHLATYPFGIYRSWPLECSGSGPGPGWLNEGSALTASLGACDSYTKNGLSLLRFSLPPSALGNASVSPQDARDYNITGPSGIIDVSACETGAPIVLSLPNFLHGSDSLRDAIDGLPPATIDADGTWIGVDPISGAALDVIVRIGINAHVKSISLVPVGGAEEEFFAWANGSGVVIPLGRGEQASGATPAQAAKFASAIYTPLRGAAAARWGGIVLAVAGLCAALALRALTYLEQRRAAASVTLDEGANAYARGVWDNTGDPRAGKGARLLDEGSEY